MTGVLRNPTQIDVDPGELVERIKFAKRTYHQLHPRLQRQLTTAMFHDKMVRAALQMGFWTSLVDALHTLAGRMQDNVWSHVAFEVDQQTPNKLVGRFPGREQ